MIAERPQLTEWQIALRKHRRAVRLTRDQLAEQAAVSPETVKAYELGRRKPSRELLVAMLDALHVDRAGRNAILMQAGFAPDGQLLAPTNPGYWFDIDRARKQIANYPWPASVHTEFMEVVALNKPAMALWSIDHDPSELDAMERNLVAGASHPHWTKRIVNWEEIMRIGIGSMKGLSRGPETSPEGTSTYFSAVMERFLAGSPEYVSRVLQMWDSVEPREPSARWTAPLEVDHPAYGRMRFWWISSVASADDGLYFVDLIPSDGATWEKVNGFGDGSARGLSI
jgi:transcriptional regulator with XRE-family HTH domain